MYASVHFMRLDLPAEGMHALLCTAAVGFVCGVVWINVLYYVQRDILICVLSGFRILIQ